MSFANPQVLLLAALAPALVLVLYFYDRGMRRRLTVQLGELPVINRVIASASPGRRAIKAVVTAVAVALLLIAAARPQLRGKRDVELHGLDLVIAVDVSKSMLVDDVGPTAAMLDKHVELTRLARARELAASIIDELPGDRIAPVVFAGAASHFPLTEDHEVAARFLYDLGPGDLPPGSNLGEVFRLSRCLLRPDLYEDLGCAKLGRRGHGGDPLRGESLDPVDQVKDEAIDQKIERGKAILVITDGGDPDADTMHEVGLARELGIAVFVVGVGSAKGGAVYDIDPLTSHRTLPKHGADGAVINSKRDDAGMTALATAAGDAKRYLIANENGEVDPLPVTHALEAVNRGLATKQITEQRDTFEPFLFAGLMLLVCETAIGTRRRRRYPEAR